MYKIEICGDCLAASANGLDSFEHSADFAKRFEENASAVAGYTLEPGHFHTIKECGRAVVNGTEDCPYDEGGFSWSYCDWCRSPLGGYRYPAVIFEPKKGNN